MEQEKKAVETVKVETQAKVETVRIKTLVKIAELTDDELLKLPVADFMIVRTLSKKTGIEHYSAAFKLFQGLTVNHYIEESTFEIICHKYGFTGGYSRYNGKCHYRLSGGRRPDGSVYYFVELVVARTLVMRSFLTEYQVTQIEVCELAKQGLKIFDRGDNMDGVVSDRLVVVVE